MRSTRHHQRKPVNKGLFTRLRRVFRTRQIYVRSEGEVQFVTLGPLSQIAGAGMLLLGVAWIAYATINITFTDQLLVVKERGIYKARLSYEHRISAMRRSIDKLNDKLMFDQGKYLKKIDLVRQDYERLVRRHEQLADFLRKIKVPAKSSGPVRKSNAAPPGLTTGSTRGSLNDASFQQKYQSAFRNETEAVAPLNDLRTRFSGIEKLEVALLDETVKLTSTRVNTYKRLYKRLGLNPVAIARNAPYKRDAAGGPYIAASAMTLGSQPMLARVNSVLQALELRDRLKLGFKRLPLQLPMRKITRISSNFGWRRDPFRKTLAMHSGLDFKGAWGAPIYATAPGRIIRAGWTGSYGRMVEIRHDNGVTTRYAHMSRVLVKVGQWVTRGTQVGRLGSTGRSTGAHLHYETRINGKAVNPSRFWNTAHALQAISQRKK